MFSVPVVLIKRKEILGRKKYLGTFGHAIFYRHPGSALYPAGRVGDRRDYDVHVIFAATHYRGSGLCFSTVSDP